MAAQDEIRAGVVEVVPERSDAGQIAVLGAGAESGMVPVGEHAGGRVCCEVALEPVVLGTALVAASDLAAVRVEGDQVPVADLVAVVAAPALARGAVCHAAAVEVVEISVGIVEFVLVITKHRARDLIELAPARLVGGLELLQRRVLVLEIPEGQHRGQVAAPEQGGGVELAAMIGGSLAILPAVVGRSAGDVARGRDHGDPRGNRGHLRGARGCLRGLVVAADKDHAGDDRRGDSSEYRQ